MASQKIIKEKSKLTTIWTNPSPTSEFSAQTISVDLSEYDCVFVYFQRDTNANALMLNPIVIFKPYILDNITPFVASNVVTGGGQLGRRIFNVSKTQVEFTNADRYTSYGGGSVAGNDLLIPNKIIGVKF